MLSVLFKYRKLIVGLLLVLGTLITVSMYSYNHGKSVTETKYEKIILDDRLKVLNKIQQIQESSAELHSKYDNMKQANEKSFKNILANSKNKGPLVVYQNNTCVITPNFIESINKAIEHANKINK